jgi:hypothetical protein
VLLREARCSSSSCSLDSSIRREVRLHRRVAHRIDVPHLQVACIAHVIGRSYKIHWIRRCIVKDRGKQSLSSWYQSARLITVQLLSSGGSFICWTRSHGGDFTMSGQPRGVKIGSARLIFKSWRYEVLRSAAVFSILFLIANLRKSSGQIRSFQSTK